MLQVSSHPCDHVRMFAMLYALELSGFQPIAKQIRQQWSEFLKQIEAAPEPEYHRCYPSNLITAIVHHARDAVKEIQARIATPETKDPIHNLLNSAWQQFWQNPARFVGVEKLAVEKLLVECERF
ncbi:MAG: hypothetical protein HC820_01490 [Hydrococcus sp. RM1_1_31]|nr:hypothetical protein [Hydrococcus sp. RM1_1_31]